MAGPGIRYWEFACTLSRIEKVTLAVPNREPISHPDFATVSYTKKEPTAGGIDQNRLRDLVARHRVIVLQGYTLYRCPGLARAIVAGGGYLAVDLYGPFGLESLERNRGDLSDRAVRDFLIAIGALNEQIRLGDFFFCASEKQRDYWLGRLEALGRINPHTYAQDRTARQLIDVVPFGLPSTPPVHRRQVLKGVHRRVAPTDRVIIWAGGIWNWLDPLSLIRAMGNIVAKRQDVKLFFLSGRRTSPKIPMMEMHKHAMRLSKELGLYDRFVFFHPWIPYEERENYMLEADIGVCFHFEHLETHFSFRTRILDYIWAGLPIVAGRGDTLGELVEREGLGFAVEPGDVNGLTQALLRLLDEPDAKVRRRENFARVAQRFTWEKVTEPLQRYCQAPWHAADKGIAAYERFTSNRWEQLVLDALRAEEEVAYLRDLVNALYSGRVMRLMNGTQKFLRRLVRPRKT